jgi:hypothetical protein
MAVESFIALEDFGSGPYCERVYVTLEVHSHDCYEVFLSDKSGHEVLEKDLSSRDQAIVNEWVSERVRDWISDQGDVA